MKIKPLLLLTTSMGCCACNVHAESQKDLLDMSLEELMNVEVTSVARKSQTLAGAAAAVFVIGNEDIRRSGATSIPEALRLAPGLQVARIDSNKWAISSRGFNGRFANKLQVLIDGRSVYTPTFSGVYWEAQDTALDDIDRIEVIRGPGAAMWGANAVNGVINIITKKASDTTGGRVAFGGGTYEKRFGSLRYGTRLDDRTYGRAYVKGFSRGAFDKTDQSTSHDPWDSYRGGFRIDHESGERDLLTLQGDLYQGDLNQGLILPGMSPPYSRYSTQGADLSGFNLLGRWKKAFSLSSEMTIQAYYDHTYRNEVFLTEQRDTFDIDAQHRFIPADDHDVVWGLAYRWTRADFSDRFPVTFDSRYRARQLISGFLQDEMTLIPDKLKVTFGAKLEYNEFTGVEGQPNVRVAWTPSPEHTLWGALSRAVRTPSWAEDSASLTGYVIPPNSALNPTILPAAAIGKGNGNFRAEVLWAFELGYRFMPVRDFSLDLALFYHDYDRLRSNEFSSATLATGPNGPIALATTVFDNKIKGQAYGAELALDWHPYDWWHLQGSYSYLRMDLRPTGVDTGSGALEGASPQQQASLRSGFKLGADLDWNLWLRYVDRLPSSGFPNPAVSIRIPSYLTLDTRLAWRPLKDLELSIVGQNLLDSRHPEFAQELYPPGLSEVPRGVYGKIDWRF